MHMKCQQKEMSALQHGSQTKKMLTLWEEMCRMQEKQPLPEGLQKTTKKAPPGEAQQKEHKGYIACI